MATEVEQVEHHILQYERMRVNCVDFQGVLRPFEDFEDDALIDVIVCEQDIAQRFRFFLCVKFHGAVVEESQDSVFRATPSFVPRDRTYGQAEGIRELLLGQPELFPNRPYGLMGFHEWSLDYPTLLSNTTTIRNYSVMSCCH